MGDIFPGEAGPAHGPVTYDQIWYWKAKLPDRKGQRCRVLARGGMGSIAVEFEDGYRVITGRYAVRPVDTEMLALARKAVERNKARQNLSGRQLELWAKTLARDLTNAGEAEYGR